MKVYNSWQANILKYDKTKQSNKWQHLKEFVTIHLFQCINLPTTGEQLLAVRDGNLLWSKEDPFKFFLYKTGNAWSCLLLNRPIAAPKPAICIQTGNGCAGSQAMVFHITWTFSWILWGWGVGVKLGFSPCQAYALPLRAENTYMHIMQFSKKIK